MLALLAACGSGSSGGTKGDASTLDKDQAGVTTAAGGAQVLAKGDPVKGGSLTMGMYAPVESLDPAGPSASGSLPQRAIFDSLFTYDVNGNIAPKLAKGIETKDNGATWTMTLPSGVKFSDGTPFNSEAVEANLERIGADGSQSRSAGDVRQIASMTTPNDTTLVMKLAKPSMVFPKIFVWGQPGAPGMVPSPTAVKKYGAQFGLHPVGAGPFMVKSFKPDGEIDLVRNPNYYQKGLPYLDALTMVPAVDTQSRLSAAEAGDIDFANTQSATDLVAASKAGLVTLKQPASTYYDLLFNLKKAPFNDVTFRKAVIEAIDLDALNQATFDGLQTPMSGIFPSTNPYYDEAAGWPTYDPDDAKKLVAAYKAKGGNPSFSLTTTSPPEFQKQATVMQQMLKDVGITMKINVSDQPTMVTEALSGNYQAQHRFTEVDAEVDQQLRQLYHTGSAGNNGQAGDPTVDKLLDQLQTVPVSDTAKRKDLYNQLQVAFAKWLPIAPLIEHQNGWYLGDKVGGFPGNFPGSAVVDFAKVWATK